MASMEASVAVVGKEYGSELMLDESCKDTEFLENRKRRTMRR
jgi:hypothetical protein